jgi:succinate dehydrogenase / fumarate reductase membrane anchor subunit
MTTTTENTSNRRVDIPKNFETVAWNWMRYSAFLLIPLAWGHLILQDVIIGVHRIDLDYVAMRWGLLGWRIYDILLLGFAFAHGMNGVRQVLRDYIHNPKTFQFVSYLLLLVWFLITAVGAIAIIAGVRQPE